jgi:hypothetical protein
MISRIHSGHARSTPGPNAFSRCHGSGYRVSSQEDARMVDLGADGETDTRRATSKESAGRIATD